MDARKLGLYFGTHPIKVLSNQPLKKIMQKDNCSWSMLLYVVELLRFDIEYKPGTTIMAHAYQTS